jgi:hypothetical protein
MRLADQKLTLHWDQIMDALELTINDGVCEKISDILIEYSNIRYAFPPDYAIKMVLKLRPLLYQGEYNHYILPGAN